MSALSYVDMILRAEPSATLAKVTVLLVVAGVSAVALRRASAAVRHVVWLAGIISAASMMALTPIAPGISLPVTRVANPRPSPATAPSAVDNVAASGGAARSISRVSTTSGVRAPNLSMPTSPEGPRAATVRQYMSRFSSLLAPESLLALWALGVACILARALLGFALVARLVRRARPVSDPGLAAVSDQLDARRVRLLVSDRIATPITAGWRRPVIVLPASAAGWSDERRRVVFVHELAHIVRGDYAAQALATVAVAVLWFHPLAWLAVARIKAEAEHAADDIVLSSGTTGVVYASHLLELARSTTPMRLSAAVSVGVVRSSRVERRFLAILDEKRSRRGLGWRAISVAALISAVLVSPLAGVRTVARAMPPRVVQARVPDVPRPGDSHRGDADSVFEHSIPATSGARLNLNLPTGGGVSVHGWDSPQIRVRAALGGEDWRDARVDLTRDGRDAVLSSTFSDGGTHSTSLSFEIWVPLKTDLELSSAGGSVAIDRVTGAFRGHTGGGSIEIRNGRGQADLSTGGGEIRVIDSRLDGTVRTGWGRVRIENNSGDLRGLANGSSSGDYSRDGGRLPTVPPPSWPLAGEQSGDVSVVNTNIGCASVSFGSDASVKSGLAISKDGGGIHLPFAPAGSALSTGGGRIVIDSTGGGIVAVTGGGDVDLKAASGDATISTGAGEVSIRVVGAAAASHNVNVCDGHGRVTLDLPSDLDATIELETAYTNNAARSTTIESGFDLTRSETHEWDDRFGTPRKFVRATGKVGAGTSVIRVSTVNGDIVVRRR